MWGELEGRRLDVGGSAWEVTSQEPPWMVAPQAAQKETQTASCPIPSLDLDHYPGPTVGRSSLPVFLCGFLKCGPSTSSPLLACPTLPAAPLWKLPDAMEGCEGLRRKDTSRRVCVYLEGIWGESSKQFTEVTDLLPRCQATAPSPASEELTSLCFESRKIHRRGSS